MSDDIAELARYASTELPKRPFLVPWVEAVELSTGWLQLRSLDSFYNLRHPILAKAFGAVRPLLDGNHTADEIAAAPGGEILPTTVLYLLKVLRTLGLLVEATAPSAEWRADNSHLLFLSQFDPNPESVAARLAAARVFLSGSELFVREVSSMLEPFGCRIVAVPASTAGDRRTLMHYRFDLAVVCSSGYTSELALTLNEAALELGIFVLHVGVMTRSAFLGPLVIPGETACVRCLRTRLAGNTRAGELPIAGDLTTDGWDPLSYPPFRVIVGGHVANEVSRIIGRYAAPATLSHCYEIGVASPATTRHPVLRVPGCPACGRISSVPDP